MASKKKSAKPESEGSDFEAEDYNDVLDGSLYDIFPSKKADSFTVIFYTDQTFTEINEFLHGMYQFQTNKNNTGIETHFTLDDKFKVVLTLYKNKKLLIQGAGSKLWRNTIFRRLSEKLTPYNGKSSKIKVERDNDVVYSHTDTPVRRTVSDEFQTPPSRVKNVINKMINKLRSPGVPERAQNSSQNHSVQESVIEIDDDTTLLKTPIESTVTTQSEDNRNQTSNYKQLFEKQMKENKQLQDTFKDIICQTKLLKSENERLQNTVTDLKKENENLTINIKHATEKVKESDGEIKTLKSKLSTTSAQNLILEEENSKLKKKIDSINKDKTQLVDQLMKSTTAHESVEDKIEAEIQDLKDSLLKELNEIKQQVESSRSIQNTSHQTPSTSTCNQPVAQKQKSATREMSKNVESANMNTSNKASEQVNTAFIAGDSITRILSTKRMSDSNLDIKIRTHSGGRVRTVENTIIKMSEDDSSFIKDTKAIVLHIGTNNVSDADQPETITDEIRDLVNTIKNINTGAKIIISSILPRKNDRLVNNIISDTNQSLKQICEDKGYYFLDNTPKFIENGAPISILYSDNIHLNPKGGKILGENMRQKINSVLNLPQTETQNEETNRRQQHFPNGRYQGRRSFDNNRMMMYMPMPFYPPPWFNNSYQENNNHHYNSRMTREYNNHRNQPAY